MRGIPPVVAVWTVGLGIGSPFVPVLLPVGLVCVGETFDGAAAFSSRGIAWVRPWKRRTNATKSVETQSILVQHNILSSCKEGEETDG